jgi:hypothetical protein
MNDRIDPTRIYRDPRLTERRGDLAGPVAALFLAIVVGTFAATGVVLVAVMPMGADRPGVAVTSRLPSPSPLLTPRPTAGATASPRVTAAPASTPSATRRPRETPRPLPAPTAAIRERAVLVVDGGEAATISVRSFRKADPGDRELAEGARLMVARIRLEARERLAYDARDWVVEDVEGRRFPSLGDDAPEPALGSGTLEPGGSRVGAVAWELERGVTIAWIVLTDGDGRDLVRVARVVP